MSSPVSNPLGSQSIRFMYNELRRTLDQAKSGVKSQADPQYLHTVIARTFDALDNAVTTLFNAKQVVQTTPSAGGTFTASTFNFTSALAVNNVTTYLYVLETVSPKKAVMTCFGVSSGTTKIAIERSPDSGITWNSVLPADLTMGPGVHVGPVATLFAITTLNVGDLLRARVDTGSALDATGLCICLEVK